MCPKKRLSLWSSQRDVDREEEPSAPSGVSAASRYPETARLIPEMELLTSKSQHKLQIRHCEKQIILVQSFVLYILTRNEKKRKMYIQDKYTVCDDII